MFQSLLLSLAEWLGVDPARSGEAIDPKIRFEQPWPQGLAILVFAACAALVLWFYRREGRASARRKAVLAFLRVAVIGLAMLLLSEMVLSVERTGLPYFVIMVDDSASQNIADRNAAPEIKKAVEDLAKAARKAGADPSANAGPDPAFDEPKRIDVSKAILTRNDGELLEALRQKHKVRVYALSNKAQPIATIEKAEDLPEALKKIQAMEASGAQSRLGDGVRQVLTELRGVAPTAVLLLSDGQVTEGEQLREAADLAKRKGVPIYPLGLGDPDPPRDLELAELLVDEVAFKDDMIPFRAKIFSQGYEGRALAVRLSEVTPLGPKELKKIEVKAPRDGVALPIEIGWQPSEAGKVKYAIEIETLERELQTVNNRVEREIDVREEKLKVLLGEGGPRYEYRHLKNFLEREKTVELSVVLLSSDPEYAEQDRVALPTFPTNREDLFQYDAIVLGDIDPSFLTSGQMESMAEFVVKKGGGMLFIAGEFFNPAGFKGTPLETLLPVELANARNRSAVLPAIKPFRPELTFEGRGSPIFRFEQDELSSLQTWERLPEMFWHADVQRAKPAAVVLAEHPQPRDGNLKVPLMAYQFVGAGKTMFNAVDETHKWRFRIGDRYFGRFWIQALRFLARSKLLGQKQAEITTDRARYQRNQPVQIRVRFPNPAMAQGLTKANVQIDRKGHGPRELALAKSAGSTNIFEGALPQAQEGEYEVKLLPPPVLEGGLPTARFRIDPPAGELERVQMNQPELRRVAELTDGKFLSVANLDDLMKALPEPQKVPLDTDPPKPLWNTWPMLCLILTLLAAEWVLRKRSQMV